MASLLHHTGGVLLSRAEYDELTEAMATVMRIGATYAPRMIDRLDREDGDPDLEADDPDIEDDDPSGQCDEDGWNTDLSRAWGRGPGCELSDPGGCEHDGREPEREC